MRFTPALVAIAGLAVPAATAAAAPIVTYNETFDTPAVNASLQSAGWQSHHGATATAYDNTSTDADASVIIGSGPSGGGDDTATGGGFGYLFHKGSTNDGDAHLYWTEEQASFGDISLIDRVELDLRNSSTSEAIRLAVEIGGAWYVTSGAVNNASSDTWTDDLSFDPGSASWLTLNFDPGTALSVGSSTSLPGTGAVTGLGFFDANHSNNNTRIDNVEVWAVPEPASLALVGLGGVVLMGRRRRH